MIFLQFFLLLNYLLEINKIHNLIIDILGATDMFLSAAYSIWLNKIILGSASRYMFTMPDITRREFFVLLPLIKISFIFGVYPNVVLDSFHLGISPLLINTPSPGVLENCNT